jgi:hypothetical protein
MRTSLVTTLMVAGALTIAYAAQEGGAPKEHSMTGCLAKADANGLYMVTDVGEGKGPNAIGIVESTANLAPHVGHKITVTGTAVPVATAEAMKPMPPKAPHYMKITAVKMVSATCP